MKPITERQHAILEYLVRQPPYVGQPPANIAFGVGITKGPRRLGSGAAARGGWTGYQSPAQHVIGSLNGLRQRGYIDFGRRRDGLSGTAYYITPAGRAALKEE